MPDLTAMTELDAVNEIIATVGQPPLNTLTDVSSITDAATAQMKLHHASRRLQLRGWEFNTDCDVPYTRDVANKIAVANNVLAADPTDTSINYVIRVDPADGVRRFWDKHNLSFELEEDLKADVVYFFAFDHLPQAMRDYVTTYAAHRFQAQFVSSRLLREVTEQDVTLALIEAERAEGRVGDHNILTDTRDRSQLMWTRQRSAYGVTAWP